MERRTELGAPNIDIQGLQMDTRVMHVHAASFLAFSAANVSPVSVRTASSPVRLASARWTHRHRPDSARPGSRHGPLFPQDAFAPSLAHYADITPVPLFDLIGLQPDRLRYAQFGSEGEV